MTAAPNLVNAPEFTVSELSSALKRTVEDAYGHVRVRGEISGFRGPHSSGHCYFALKDQSAKIEAVIWRTSFARMRFKPQEGLEVIATGKLTTFPGSSKYQIVIDTLEPAGVGALMALMEERKKKLAAEGLFDEARKKPLPWLPQVIGVVTSPTGAVIRDILHRLSDRFPRHVVVWPVKVQGEGSAEQVAAAINGFNALAEDGPTPRPDLLIVARGGGSLEDLWAFNEEIVVRAAAASTIPLISAVGHETDTTLIDHASDRRAPTPTAAAEIAVPVRAELLADVMQDGARLARAMRRLTEEARLRLEGLARGLPRPAQLIAERIQTLDGCVERLLNARIGYFRRRWDLISRLSAELPTPRQQIETHRQAVLHAGERLGACMRALLRERGQRLALARLEGRLLGDMLNRLWDRLEGLDRLLESLSYEQVLARGFALVRDSAGKPVLRAAAVERGASLC